MKILFNCNLQLCQKKFQAAFKHKVVLEKKNAQGYQKMNHSSDFEKCYFH